MRQDKQKHTVYTDSIKLQVLSLTSFHRLDLTAKLLQLCNDVWGCHLYFYCSIGFRAWEVTQMLREKDSMEFLSYDTVHWLGKCETEFHVEL